MKPDATLFLPSGMTPEELEALLTVTAATLADNGMTRRPRVWLVSGDDADPAPAALDAVARRLRPTIAASWTGLDRVAAWVCAGVTRER